MTKNLFVGIFALVAGFAMFGGVLPTAHAAVPTAVSARITGPNTVTIIFSEPVNTNMGSFYAFTGALSGHNLVGLSGGGSNTIVLNFDGLPISGTGGLTISGGTFSLSDNAPYNGGAVTVIGGQGPVLLSFSVFSTNAATALGKVGDVLNINFTMSQAINTPTVTIAGHPAYPSGTGAGPYSALYTVAPQDITGAPLSATINFSDNSGNSGNAAFSFSTGGSSSASSPIITSIYSDARVPGALKVGGTITFTLNLLTAVPNARVNATYNNVPLLWTASNGGTTYTATYTVAAGNSNQTAPLQLSGVTITDLSSGATSAPASGYDVAKTISANAPYLVEAIPVSPAVGTQNPTYTFNSNASGTATYGGDCTSPTIAVVSGANTVTFVNVSPGLHNNCTITVTDTAGNASSPLQVSPFTVLGGSSTSTITTAAQTAATTAAATSSALTQLQALQSQLLRLRSGQVAQLQQSQAASQSTAAAPPAAASYKFTTLLKLGSRGAEVKELQKRLAAEGFLSAAPNGVFGPATEAAVKKYQKAHGLKQAGELGPATRALLNK